MTVRYTDRDNPLNAQVALARRPGKWWLDRRCVREAVGGDGGETWRCRRLAEAPAPSPPSPATVTPPVTGDDELDAIGRSLVSVDYDVPFGVQGYETGKHEGTGVIVDAERGWVVVDRSTVPDAVGDMGITFAGSLRVPGTVLYIHPLHNLVVVSYDPAVIGTTAVTTARLSTAPLRVGQRLSVAGYGADARLKRQSVEVASIDALNFAPNTRRMTFRDANLDIVSLVSEAPEDLTGGVLTDESGAVAALWCWWMGFKDDRPGGIPAELVAEMLDHLREGTELRSLEVVWEYRPLTTARELGLPAEWLRRYERHRPGRQRVLAVKSLVAGAPAADQLVSGDVLLAIGDKLVASFREAERLTQRPSVPLRVFRDGHVLDVDVETVAFDGTGIDHLVFWAGALVELPFRTAAAEWGIDPNGVYVGSHWYGSPFDRYDLPGRVRIVEVGGRPTPDLKAFADAIEGQRHGVAVRVKTLDRYDAPGLYTLRVDRRDWPPYELRRIDGTWQLRELD